MNLSKSKYCSAVQCKKMLWLSLKNPSLEVDISNQAVLDNGTDVGIVAKDLFPKRIDISFSSNLTDMINDTNKALLQKSVVITEASFSYKNNFCSVDILVKNDKNFEIYEVKSSTHIKDIYIEDVSYQFFVLSNLGYNVSKASIVYLNPFYERQGKLDLSKLFVIKDVTSIVKSKQSEIKMNIDEIDTYMKQEKEPSEEIGMHCVNPYSCPYFEYCTSHLEKPNIFSLRRMQDKTKFRFYSEGIYRYQDLLLEKIDSRVKQQIEFELYHLKPSIQKEKIKDFLKTLSYPLYFLDFETYQQAIPQFDGVKPYMQIPFQYSLHFIDEDGNLRHCEFLAPTGVDPRRLVAERLVCDIPKDVCVLAYNMSFEKSVIKNLANLYPDLKEKLMNIYDNIKDLMVPFYERSYYDESMKGSYSIKYVLPALFPHDPKLDYHNLDDIHNGSEAMNAYATLKDLSKEEQEQVRKNLLKYCELDTYAMVKIWEKLKESVCQ